MFRTLRSSTKHAKIMAGFGAITAGLAGAVAFGVNTAENNCISKVKAAYQKFMPTMDYPDLSQHNNCLKKVLTPQMYAKLRDLVSYNT